MKALSCPVVTGKPGAVTPFLNSKLQSGCERCYSSLESSSKNEFGNLVSLYGKVSSRVALLCSPLVLLLLLLLLFTSEAQRASGLVSNILRIAIRTYTNDAGRAHRRFCYGSYGSLCRFFDDSVYATLGRPSGTSSERVVAAAAAGLKPARWKYGLTRRP